MKAFIFILLSTLLPLAANPLSPFQWKKRLLIVNVDRQDVATVKKQLAKQSEALKERDLVVLNLSKDQSAAFTSQAQLTEKDIAALRQTYQITDEHKSTFILVGKDGGEKSRQKETLSMDKIFALIDSMPMRQSEMQK